MADSKGDLPPVCSFIPMSGTLVHQPFSCREASLICKTYYNSVLFPSTEAAIETAYYQGSCPIKFLQRIRESYEYLTAAPARIKQWLPDHMFLGVQKEMKYSLSTQQEVNILRENQIRSKTSFNWVQALCDYKWRMKRDMKYYPCIQDGHHSFRRMVKTCKKTEGFNFKKKNEALEKHYRDVLSGRELA